MEESIPFVKRLHLFDRAREKWVLEETRDVPLKTAPRYEDIVTQFVFQQNSTPPKTLDPMNLDTWVVGKVQFSHDSRQSLRFPITLEGRCVTFCVGMGGNGYSQCRSRRRCRSPIEHNADSISERRRTEIPTFIP